MPRFAIPILVCTVVLQVLIASAHAGILAEVASYGQKEVVTFSEVRNLTGLEERQANDTLRGTELLERIKQLRIAAVDHLIDHMVILQDARSKGIEIPDAVVDNRIEAIIKEKFAGDRKAFERHLAGEGYTLQKFREEEHDEILDSKSREKAWEGAATAEEARRQEEDWIQNLRRHAYIKKFEPVWAEVLD